MYVCVRLSVFFVTTNYSMGVFDYQVLFLALCACACVHERVCVCVYLRLSVCNRSPNHRTNNYARTQPFSTVASSLNEDQFLSLSARKVPCPTVEALMDTCYTSFQPFKPVMHV